MKALVVGADFSECGRVTRVLRDGGHEVRSMNDEKAALAALGADPAHVVLVCPLGPNDALLEFLRQLRVKALHTTPILLGGDVAEPFLVRALDAGVDAEFRRNGGKEYLLARVNAVLRTIQSALHPPEKKPEPAAGAAPAAAADTPPVDTAPLDRLVRTAAWRNAPAELVAVAGKYLTVGTSVDGSPPGDASVQLGSGLVMSNVKDQVELRVALGTDAASAEALAVHMMGKDGEGMGADILSELTNMCMGALKASFGSEAVPFTAGVPAPLNVEHVLRPPNLYRFQEAFVMKAADARLVIHIGVRSRANLFLKPSDITEGLVLAKDVFNGKGLLLITAGTRLSATMIDKLRNVLSPTNAVEVMAP